jgi:chromate reductase, NAD(P)H dehydrogenase (quinone)
MIEESPKAFSVSGRMDKPMNVCVLVGSLRKASFNGMLANALISLAPSSMNLGIVEIGQFPLYNEDLETAAPPAPWTAFRQRVKAADAVLFVTAEYNRSVPAVLKNALDVGSRPYGSNVWDRKPGAIVSGSPGAIGGFGANHHLRQSLVFLNVPAMQQPEAYISHVDKLFDEHGELVSDGTRKFLQGFMQAFANWVETSASDGLRQARASAAAG